MNKMEREDFLKIEDKFDEAMDKRGMTLDEKRLMMQRLDDRYKMEQFDYLDGDEDDDTDDEDILGDEEDDTEDEDDTSGDEESADEEEPEEDEDKDPLDAELDELEAELNDDKESKPVKNIIKKPKIPVKR